MANTGQVSQDKLKVYVAALQPAIGTPVALNSASLIKLPLYDVSIKPDQGTRIIDRAQVMDGYAGQALGVSGSWGWSVSFKCELQYVSDAVFPFCAMLMAASGHSGSIVNTDRYKVTPTTAPIVGWNQTDQGWGGSSISPYVDAFKPSALTLIEIVNNNGVWDYARIVQDLVGTLTVRLTAGQRVELEFNGRGVVGETGIIDPSDTDLANVGAYQSGSGTPVVFKGATIAMTLNGDDVMAPIQEIVFEQRANVELVDDPTAEYGYQIAPVLMDVGAQITVNPAENSDNYVVIREALIAGQLGALTFALSAGAQQLSFEAGYIQQTEMDESAARNGYRALGLTLVATRPAGSSTPAYFFTIDPTP